MSTNKTEKTSAHRSRERCAERVCERGMTGLGRLQVSHNVRKITRPSRLIGLDGGGRNMKGGIGSYFGE